MKEQMVRADFRDDKTQPAADTAERHLMSHSSFERFSKSLIRRNRARRRVELALLVLAIPILVGLVVAYRFAVGVAVASGH